MTRDSVSDTYVSREEMDELFDGLAAASGRTRAQFENHLAELRAPSATDEHLTFMEADDLEGLSIQHGAHLNDCAYCKRLVELLYEPPDFRAVDRMVDEEVASRPRLFWDRYRLVWAPTLMVVGVVIGVIGAVFAIPATEAVATPSAVSYYSLFASISAPLHLASPRTTMAVFTARVRQDFLEPSSEPRLLTLDIAADEFFKPDVRSGLLVTKEQFYRDTVPFGAIIYREAKRNDLPPELVAAIVHTEADFRRQFVSAKSSQGLMQIVPDTTRILAISDPYDPQESIAAGTRYFRYLLTRFDDQQLALAAYNAGEGNVERYGGVPPFEETRRYIEKVNARTSRYRQRALLASY